MPARTPRTTIYQANAEHDGELVLAGDAAQMSSIGTGGLSKELEGKAPTAELTEVTPMTMVARLQPQLAGAAGLKTFQPNWTPTKPAHPHWPQEPTPEHDRAAKQVPGYYLVWARQVVG